MPADKFGNSGNDDTCVASVSTSIGLTLSLINNVFLCWDGENKASGNLDVKSQKIINVAHPGAIGDATNKKYVDQSAVNQAM